MSSSLQPPAPLPLTIRFSSTHPDLALDIPAPHTTRVAALKQLIRAALPPADAPRALRLIYHGRLLHDPDTLAALAPPAAPQRPADPKGKAPEAAPRVYILAGLGAALPPAALATEAALATCAPPGAPLLAPPPDAASTPRAPSPRGFDRLLDAGLSASEVNQLRLQFASIQESRFTADSMPSPDGLRRMEDAWIDSNGTLPPSAATATATDEEPGAEDSVDALMRGLVLGFFWPLGCLAWALREDGIWSRRRHYSVWVGVVLGVSVGALRFMGSEGGY